MCGIGERNINLDMKQGAFLHFIWNIYKRCLHNFIGMVIINIKSIKMYCTRWHQISLFNVSTQISKKASVWTVIRFVTN